MQMRPFHLLYYLIYYEFNNLVDFNIDVKIRGGILIALTHEERVFLVKDTILKMYCRISN